MTERMLISIIVATGMLTSMSGSGMSYTTYGQITGPVGSMYGVDIDYAWPTEEPGNNVLRCYTGKCYLGVAVLFDPGIGFVYNPSAQTVGMLTYRDRETLSSVRSRFISRFGISGHYNISNWSDAMNRPYFDTAHACFQYWPYNRDGTNTLGVNLPDTACGNLAPPDVTCESLPSMVFDFGVVRSGATSGLQLTQQQTVQCTNATNVTLKLLSGIKLSRTLTANMSVNGRTLDPTGVSLEINGNTIPLDFVVTINGNENTGGEYTASSVLIMEYR